MIAVKELMVRHHKLLTELNTSFIQEHGSPLFIDLAKLAECCNSCDVDDDTITYDAPKITVRNYFPPAHTIPASNSHGIQHIDIALSLNNITIRKPAAKIQDPLTRLDGFDITLQTQHNHPNYYYASWHLDKRIVSERYSLIEPEYHLTFGGRNMEKLYAQNMDFGSALIVRAPRIMHPPMDVILGIDFILNQFIDREYSGDILENVSYRDIVSTMRGYLWKPFATGLAKNFYTSWNDSHNLSFDDEFCKNVVGD
ncbi:MAG: hypothetical protein BGO70_14345 [Bacteroidetes bacterium 43-93]|nr:MAG: hypothetical protein BGO70_14345 [Bacteroidetes bacterium 43-93]